MNAAQTLLRSQWSVGVRKVLAHLFPTWGAREQPFISDQKEHSFSRKPKGSKPDFWSDFSRHPGASFREEDQAARNGDKLLNILVPFDFTTSSFTALDCALRIAQQGKAHVTLLHTVFINLSPYGPANVALIKQDMRQEAEAQISYVVALAKRENVAVDYVVEDGKPSAVIENFMKEQPLDLVILAGHRHRRLGRFSRRKTMEKVIRQAQCPVLVLRTDDSERTLQ